MTPEEVLGFVEHYTNQSCVFKEQAHVLLCLLCVCVCMHVSVHVCMHVVAQEKSQIEVYWRPLSHSASALVFLSRRTDMPYLYHTSLAKLNYDAGSYEVCTPQISYPVVSSLY